MNKQTIIIRDEAVRERVVNVLANLNIEKPWEVTIQRHTRKRSLSQNSLMWKWLNEVADHVRDHTGMDSDDIHEFFKAKFLPAKIVDINGESAEYRTTKSLTTSEMADYMNRIYAWATSELGLLLPVPEELGR